MIYLQIEAHKKLTPTKANFINAGMRLPKNAVTNAAKFIGKTQYPNKQALWKIDLYYIEITFRLQGI